MNCIYCGELIDPRELFTDAGGSHMHRCCLLRSVVGSVGHIKKKCSCFGGTEEDPPGLSKYEAAQAAEKLYLKLVEEKQYFPA